MADCIFAPGVNLLCSSEVNLVKSISVRKIESCRNQEDRQQYGESEASDECLRQRCVGLAALAEFKGHGQKTDYSSQRSHQDWTKTDTARCRNGLTDGHALFQQMVGELHDQDAVRESDASQHDDSHQRHNVQGRTPKQQRDNHTGDAGREREKNDEGIGEGPELRHQNEIEQQDGQSQANGEAAKRGVHRSDAAGE